MQQRIGSGSYGEKNVKNLTKPLDKVATAPIITSDFGLRTSARSLPKTA